MIDRRSRNAVLAFALCILMTSCGDTTETATAETPLSDVLDPGTGEGSLGSLRPDDVELLPASVDLENATPPLSLALRSTTGYRDADGQLILDVVEGESVYLTVSIQDAEKRPVRGVLPKVTPARDSRFVRMSREPSDDLGNYPLGLMGGSMGEEQVQIAAGDTVESLMLNVISQRATGFGWMGNIEDALDWDLLFQAQIEWGEKAMTATFPDALKAKSGKTVKVAGFMMPLEATQKQSHFLITSSPPDCFFHLPGGPAGAVEVFAAKPVEVGWDPVMIEGRFEALDSSEIGVVYRLHDAKAIPLAAPQ